MRLAVITNEQLKEELLTIPPLPEVEWIWLNDFHELASHQTADAVIDLLFDNDEIRMTILKEFFPKPVIINSVLFTLEEIHHPFIRINAWPTFLKRQIAEVSCNYEGGKENAEEIFRAMGRKTEWIPDIAGFIAPRVVVMIINEAYFALEEKVSAKEEIDIAMKLGTNYPSGPFEWAEKIGLKKIVDLLTILSKKEKRYKPAALLVKEAG